MDSQKLTKEIAILERQLSQTKNETLKNSITKKIARLKNDLAGSQMSTSELAKKLLGAKQKVQRLTASDFNEVIRRLSKKPEYHFLKHLTKQEIKDDLKRTAKPVGYRFKGEHNYRKPTKQEIIDGKKDGTVYYENRSNRADVSRTVQLKTGGNVTLSKTVHPVVKQFVSNTFEDDYKINNKKAVYEYVSKKWDSIDASDKRGLDTYGKLDLLGEHWGNEDFAHLEENKIVERAYKTGGNVEKVTLKQFIKEAKPTERQLEQIKILYTDTMYEYVSTPANEGLEDLSWFIKNGLVNELYARGHGWVYKTTRKGRSLYTEMKKQNSVEKNYVAVNEKDGHWVVVSKPSTKKDAQAQLDLGVQKGYTGKVVTVDQLKDHKKVIYKDGGNIPNNYEGKTPAQVWDAWSPKQREHFLIDHMGENYPMSSTKQCWSELLEDEKDLVAEHITKGQYGCGGSVPKAEKGMVIEEKEFHYHSNILSTWDELGNITDDITTFIDQALETSGEELRNDVVLAIMNGIQKASSPKPEPAKKEIKAVKPIVKPEPKKQAIGTIKVSTREYKLAYNKEPRGMGMWFFEIGGERVTPNKSMDYKFALKWARQQAKKMNVDRVKVLS
jgi:hypothetical protein